MEAKSEASLTKTSHNRATRFQEEFAMEVPPRPPQVDPVLAACNARLRASAITVPGYQSALFGTRGSSTRHGLSPQQSQIGQQSHQGLQASQLAGQRPATVYQSHPVYRPSPSALKGQTQPNDKGAKTLLRRSVFMFKKNKPAAFQEPRRSPNVQFRSVYWNRDSNAGIHTHAHWTHPSLTDNIGSSAGESVSRFSFSSSEEEETRQPTFIRKVRNAMSTRWNSVRKRRDKRSSPDHRVDGREVKAPRQSRKDSFFPNHDAADGRVTLIANRLTRKPAIPHRSSTVRTAKSDSGVFLLPEKPSSLSVGPRGDNDPVTSDDQDYPTDDIFREAWWIARILK